MSRDIQIIIVAVFAAFMLLAVISFLVFAVVKYRRAKIDHRNELLRTQIKVRNEAMKYVSEELHDDVGQLLSLSRIHAFQLNENHPEDESAIELLSLITSSLEKVRNISHVLINGDRGQLNLSEIIKEEKRKINALGDIEILMNGDLENIDVESEKVPFIHRIIQEALNNIVKHSEASEIELDVSQNEHKKIIRIRDNGKGFDSSKGGLKGIGLKNMQERADLIGAEIIINSAQGKGSSIELIL